MDIDIEATGSAGRHIERTPGTRPRVGTGTLLLYGFGASAIGIKTRALNNFLLLFYNQAVGMSPQAVALAVTIITVVEAVADPMIGYLSDNLRSKWGRRHPLMYASVVPVGASFYLLWNPPSWISAESVFFYLLGCLLLLRLSIAAFEIPSTSLAPELAEEYHRRTVVVSIRIFFRTIAGLLFTVAAFQVFLSDDRGGVTDTGGYFAFALAGSAVMVASILVCALSTQRLVPWLRRPDEEPAAKPHFIGDMLGLWREPAARNILLVQMLIAVFVGSNSGLELYFGLYFWQLTQAQLSVIATVTAVATLLGAVVGPVFSARVGKLRGVLLTLPVSLLGFVVPVVLRLAGLLPLNGTQFIFLMLAATAALHGVLYLVTAALLNSMMSDVVEEVEVATGKRSEGLLFSADAFFSKAVSGLGILISGSILWLIAFPRDAKPGAVAADVVWHLGAIYVPAITVMMVGIMLVLIRFPIDERRHERNLALLRERRGDALEPPLVAT